MTMDRLKLRLFELKLDFSDLGMSELEKCQAGEEPSGTDDHAKAARTGHRFPRKKRNVKTERSQHLSYYSRFSHKCRLANKRNLFCLSDETRRAKCFADKAGHS